MKTLLSINNYHYLRGGAEAVYFSHAEQFASNGWKTSFFSMHHDENLPCNESQYFVDCIDYAKEGKEGPTLTNAAEIIYSIKARRQLARLLDAKKADVAHAHNIYHHLSPSVLVELRTRGIPTVMSAHDLKLACPSYLMLNRTGVCERCRGGRLWNAIRYRCIKESLAASALVALESAVHRMFGLYQRNLDRVITPSRFLREKLIAWGYEPAWIVHIPNPARVPEAALSLPGDYILYFGRLSPEKGVATLIQAAARGRVKVRIVGTGPLETALRNLAVQLSAPIEFLGFLSGEDLWSQVRGARAVVVPSECYENSPMGAIEALAHGKPLIGANIGGIPELIPDGATGWLFTSGDADALAEALDVASAASSAQLRAMGEAAREYVEITHSPSRYFDAVSSLYAELGVR